MGRTGPRNSRAGRSVLSASRSDGTATAPAVHADELCAKIQRELLPKYEAAFGCVWPATPWGTSWPEVVRDAHEADLAYDRAKKCLQELERASREAVDVFIATGLFRKEFRGFDAPAAKYDARANLTTPELMLGALFQLKRDLALLPDETRASIALLKVYVKRPGARMPAMVTYGNSADWRAFRAYCDTTFREGGTSRRWSRRRATPSVLGSSDTYYPGLVGPLPRSLTKMSEWQRAYLVGLLGEYPLHACDRPPGFATPTDEAIAIVSLLCGNLERTGQTKLAKGAASVVRYERRAIRVTRKRRSLAPSLGLLPPSQHLVVVPPST